MYLCRPLVVKWKGNTTGSNVTTDRRVLAIVRSSPVSVCAWGQREQVWYPWKPKTVQLQKHEQLGQHKDMVLLCCSAFIATVFDPWLPQWREGKTSVRTQLAEIETFLDSEGQRGPSSSSWPVFNRLRQTSRVPDYLRDVLGLAPGALVGEQCQAVDVCRWCRPTQYKQCATNLNPAPHDCT